MTEKRKLDPRKLAPPPDIGKRIIEADAKILPANPIIRFFKLFFGEGF